MKKTLNVFFRRAVSLTFVTVAILLFASCGKTQNAPLNVSEMFFGQKLSSVSADSYNADRFFVGTEDGNIFVLNTATNDVDTLLTSFDRIYKVVPDMTAQGLRYWVGTRNMGLLLCARSADSLVAVTRYVLPAAERVESYSAYDVYVHQTGVFVATSHGLLKVTSDKKNQASLGTDTLAAIFVNRVGDGGSVRLQPLVAFDLRSYGEDILLCASDKGLLKVDVRSDMVETFINRKVSGIGLHGKDVMVVVEDGPLLKVDINGCQLAEVSLPQHAKSYFYDETNAMNYLVSDGHVQLFRDEELDKPAMWQQMEVGMSVPANCHNVILSNVRQRQSLLLGKYSVLRVANHQDVFNTIGEVELACANDGKIYYLVGRSLFCQEIGSDVAVQIKDLSGGTGDVKFMKVLGNRIYYVDSSSKAYSAHLYSSYLVNSLLSYDSPVSPAVKHEVTAMGDDGKNIYLGVRDGLVNLHRADSCLDSHVFINRFVRSGDKVAFATLNDGVYIGRDNSFKPIAGSEKFAFVRDMAFASSVGNDSASHLYILTNHALLLSNGADSLSLLRPATGYRRLLAINGTHLYGVADFGIDNLSDSTRLFSDVHFEPEACLVANGKIYAGSGSGVYVFGDAGVNGGNAESGYSIVRFVTKSFYSRTNIILLVLLSCLSVGFVWWYDRRKRRMRMVTNIQDRLHVRVVELGKVKHLLGDTLCQCIDRWTAEIDSIARLSPVEARRRADILNKDIQKATFKVPTVLAVQIERQIGVLNTKKNVKKCADRIHKSQQARIGGDVLEMARVIADNEEWLQKVHENEAILDGLAAVFKGMANLPGVTDEIIRQLDVYIDPAEKLKRMYAIIGKKEVENMEIQDVISLFKSYLSSPEFVEKTKDCVDDKLKDLMIYEECMAHVVSFKSIYDGLVDALQHIQDNLESTQPDVFDALSKLPLLCMRSDMLLAVVKVHLYIDRYFSIMKQVDDTKGLQRGELIKELFVYSNEMFEKGCIVDEVRRFYEAADACEDQQLLAMINLTRKKGEGLFLSEKLLVLMMAHSGKKVSTFSEMACASDQHLRKLRREIIGDGIELCLDDLKDYAKKNPMSFATLLLDAYEMYKMQGSEKYIGKKR